MLFVSNNLYLGHNIVLAGVWNPRKRQVVWQSQRCMKKESGEARLTPDHFLVEPRLKAQNIHTNILRIRKIRLSLGESEGGQGSPAF